MSESAHATDAPEGLTRSPWGPLRNKLFLAIWIAATASNIGTWIQTIGEKWQMAELTKSPLLISLIETGSTLPMLALAMAAGAIADILDRRKLLIAAQAYMMLVAGALAGLTFTHRISPAVLLIMSLLLGIGAAVNAPTWSALIPEILPRRQIPAGVTLNSASYNVSRAVGPALGGFVVGWLGPGWAFALNAVSFMGTVMVLGSWKRRAASTDLPAERFTAAMKVGVRYVRNSRPLQVILLRALGFVWFAGIIFSLTPSLAIHQLSLGSSAFGLLMGCIGAGAVLATAFFAPMRARFSTNQLLAGSTLVFAAALSSIALFPKPVPVAIALFFCGVGWNSTLSTINTGIQLSVPPWVKARAFGTYITTWGGAMALGAAFWGAMAQRLGLLKTFGIAAAGMVIVLLLIGRLRIEALEHQVDLSPHRSEPHPSAPIRPEAGPILVSMEYCVPIDKAAAFREAMREVRRIRIRDGAVRWSLFHELPNADGTQVFLESYFSSSWGEHLRQHHRATVEDRAHLAAAYRLATQGRPKVRHLIATVDEQSSLLDYFLG